MVSFWWTSCFSFAMESGCTSWESASEL